MRLWNLIKNEMKKMVSKKRFTVILIMTIAIVAFGTFVTYKNVEDEITVKQVERLEESINYYEGKKEYALKNEQLLEADNYNAWLEIDKNELKHKKRLLDDQISSKDKLKEDIKYLNKKKDERFTAVLDTEIQKIDDEILIKQYYLDNNLEYDYANNVTAFKAMPKFFSNMGRLFIIAIVGLLALDIVSGENDPSTIKMLLTKPVSRGKILISKFITVFLMGNGIIIALEFIAFIILGLILGFGDSSAPIVAGTMYKTDISLVENTGQSISAVLGSSYMITYLQFIIKALIIQAFLITATIAFCFLISTLIKNSGVSTGIGFIVIFLLICVTIKITAFSEPGLPGILNKILPFIFTSYFDITLVIDGSWAGSLICPLITYNFALIVLTIWIVGCYVISHINFIKKDII